MIDSKALLLCATLACGFLHGIAQAQDIENDPVAIALDNTQYQFGASDFYPVTSDSTQGGSSMESRFSNSTVFPTIGVFLSGDVTLIFDYKFKRQVLGDKLLVEAYGQFGPLASMEVANVSFDGWRSKSFYVPPGTESLNWTLFQVNAETMASIDNVRVLPGNQTSPQDKPFTIKSCQEGTPFLGEPVAEAVDNTNFDFFSDGQFFPQNLISNFGGDAVQAKETQFGDIMSFGTRVISSAPFELSFDWKVSSFQNGDFLVFELFNSAFQPTGIRKQISGEIDWETETFSLPPGHFLPVWRYINSSPGEAGENTGWVDKLRIAGSLDPLCQKANVAPMVNLLLSD